VVSEGSVKQNCDLTNRNRIRGSLDRTSVLLIAKSISIKDQGCISGRCAAKAVGLTSGDLRRVPRGTEEIERFPDRAAEVSRGHSRHAAKGIPKARTAPVRG